MNTLLIVDDEQSIRRSLYNTFKNDYKVIEAESGEEAIAKVKRNCLDLILLDQKLYGIDGIETLQKIREIDPKIIVIMITAYGSIESSVKAMKLGAHDYIVKPFDTDEIKIIVSQALSFHNLRKEVQQLRDELSEKYGFQNIVGKSPLMREVYELIHDVASSDIVVLVQGESGTGKELVARAIHYSSPRRSAPFVPINCAALPENLLESELFGYERGAFTGATTSKKGKIETADGGTLFLDEIADMSPRTQAKLLRFLQDGTFERLGSVEQVEVNVRIISATNEDIEGEVERNNFREDLYYRIKGVTIELPPLVRRSEDIPLLAQHFLQEYSSSSNKEITAISPEAMELLMNHNWRGNVRELKNVIERAVVLSKDSEILPKNLPPDIRKQQAPQHSAHSADAASLEDAVERIEKAMIQGALDKVKGNRTQAARSLKISLRTLQYKLKKYGL